MQRSQDEMAKANGKIIGAATQANVRYLKSLKDKDWESPTGCEDWNIRRLAEHLAGGSANYSAKIQEVINKRPSNVGDLKLATLDNKALVDLMESNCMAMDAALQKTTPTQATTTVQMSWGSVPLANVAGTWANESVLHGWDLQIGRNPNAAIPADWAKAMIPRAEAIIGGPLADPEAAMKSEGVYLLQVSDGVGPKTITVKDGKLSLTHGAAAKPDVTIALTADQYLRLLWGRMPLESEAKKGLLGVILRQGAKVKVTGKAKMAKNLNDIFQGI
ncbi:MAG: maleylpyruvate isomerase family mycothiol-dependent enzyme [Chloroflexi bacterium]|nr:maleylpyruvate isomerase family mycothiol-dependent enzyme [Chloroflexota bacterium]